MKNMLKATAIPSLNLNLDENLSTEISLRYSKQFLKGVEIHSSRSEMVKRKKSTREEGDISPSRARISTIVVVDMIKDRKTTRVNPRTEVCKS